MNKFYFTFGHGQNPGIGYYTIIEAKDEEAAREIMHTLYDNKWSFCYTSPEKAGVEKYDLKSVEPGFKFREMPA